MFVRHCKILFDVWIKLLSKENITTSCNIIKVSIIIVERN